jgi:hypothetical protein
MSNTTGATTNPSSKLFLRSRGDGFIVLGLIVLSLVFYARAPQFDFVGFDDPTVLLEHPSLYDETSFVSGARAIFSEFPREEPLILRDLSWAVDARVYGFANPFGYHLGNVIVNAAVVGLLFLLLCRWTHDPKLAGLISLAFLVVPVHVEPVCWVMGRKDLLVAAAMLLGLLSQSFALGARTRRWRHLAYVGTLLCCVLALGSKISAIAFPIVLMLHRFFYPYLEGACDHSAPVKWRAALLRAVPPLIPHFSISVVVFIWYRGVLSASGNVFPSQGPTGLDPEHLLNVALFLPLIAGEYLKSLFLPYDFSVSYRWPSVGLPLSPWELASSGLWAFGLVASIALLLWKRRDLAFYLLFTLALLSPYVGLFYVGFWRADRYMYLASAGLLVILGVGGRDLVRRWPRSRVPIAALVLVFLTASALTSWSHQEIWRNNESLWSYEIGRTEPSLLAFQALAIEYADRSRTTENPREKNELIFLADEVAKQGFARRREIKLVPTLYTLPEQLDISRLYEVKNMVAIYHDVPPGERVQYLRLAFKVAPNARSAWLVARTLYSAAEDGPENTRDEFVSESLDYYEKLLAFSVADPIQLKKNLTILDTHYGENFPFLDDRLVGLRARYMQ